MNEANSLVNRINEEQNKVGKCREFVLRLC